MNWKKLGVLMLVAVMLSTVIAGCSTSTSKKDGGKTIRWIVGAEPQSLDPAKVTGIPEYLVLNQIFEGLCSRDANNKPCPGIAERWDISADGLKYTFYLRDAKWSNGDPVTAQDFEFAWKRMLSADTASEYAEMLYYIKNGEKFNKQEVGADQVGIKVINDKTLEVTLEAPTAYFLLLLAHHSYFPVNKKVVEANANWSAEPSTIVGNGPFKIVAWNHNSTIEVIKNDMYWDAGNVKSDKIIMSLTELGATALSMFENNQIDLVDQIRPPAAETESLIKEGKMKLYPQVATYYFEFNNKKAPFNNPKVRKAFALAIDREAIVMQITKAGEKAATSWVPPGINDAKEGKDFQAVSGALFKDNDVAVAKQLLAEAGYPDGKGLPPITILYNTMEMHKSIAEAIQEMWKKNLGVEVNITNQEWKVYLANRTQGDFQVCRAGWVGDYADPMTFIDTLTTGNGNNRGKYSNAEYDKLAALAKSTLDQNVRMKAMHDAEKILIEDMGIMPIYFYTNTILEKKNIKGVIRTSDGFVSLKGAYLE